MCVCGVWVVVNGNGDYRRGMQKNKGGGMGRQGRHKNWHTQTANAAQVCRQAKCTIYRQKANAHETEKKSVQFFSTSQPFSHVQSPFQRRASFSACLLSIPIQEGGSNHSLQGGRERRRGRRRWRGGEEVAFSSSFLSLSLPLCKARQGQKGGSSPCLPAFH